MKTLFLLLGLILAMSCTAFGQNGLAWSAAAGVAPVSFGSGSPRMALLPDGSPVVVWGKNNQIWFAKSANGAFSAPVQIGTGGVVPGIYEFGGLDVAVSAQRVFVVFENFEQGIYCVRSEDGGNTWQPPVVAFAAPAGRATTIASIAVDAAGNPIISFLYQTASETNANVQVLRSLDGGVTFAVSVDASATTGEFACECCYQDLLLTGGDTVLVAFRANRNNIRDMWVARSTTAATVFDAACDLDAQDWQVNLCPTSGPRLARLAGDSVLSVWMSKNADGPRVFGSTFHAGSMAKDAEFNLPTVTTAATFNQNHPDVAGNRDTVAVVWEETGFVGTGQDIVCAFSTSGVAGLLQNAANVAPVNFTQKFPQIAYQNGVFHLIYTDPIKGIVYQQGIVVAPVSADEVVPQDLSLFPNPAQDWVTVANSKRVVRAQIFTITGQLALETPLVDGRIAVSALPAGMYMVNFFGKNTNTPIGRSYLAISHKK